MRVVPKTFRQVVEFAEAHAPVWEVDPAQIGLDGKQVGALVDQAKLAREAYDRAIKAREAAVAATAAMRAEVAALRKMLGGYVATIKAFARGGGPEGYPPDQILAIAQIDPPKKRGSGGDAGRSGGEGGRQSVRYGDPPGQPRLVRTHLWPTGAVEVSWAAERAASRTGAYFTVLRKLPGEGAWRILGTSPGLSRTRRRAVFLDSTLPAGSPWAEYQIVGQRGRVRGESSGVVTVNLGVFQPPGAVCALAGLASPACAPQPPPNLCKAA